MVKKKRKLSHNFQPPPTTLYILKGGGEKIFFDGTWINPKNKHK
jgi:hypothetical protein